MLVSGTKLAQVSDRILTECFGGDFLALWNGEIFVTIMGHHREYSDRHMERVVETN